MQYSLNNDRNLNLSNCTNIAIISSGNEIITFLCNDPNGNYIVQQSKAIFCPSPAPTSFSPTPTFTPTPLQTPVVVHNYNGCNINEMITLLNDGAMILCSGQNRTYIIPGNIFCQPALPNATSASTTFTPYPTPSSTPATLISGSSTTSSSATRLASETPVHSMLPLASISSIPSSSSQPPNDCNRDHGNGVPNGNCNGHDKKTSTASPSKTSGSSPVPSVSISNKPTQVNSHSLISSNDDNNVYHISVNAINVTIAFGLGNNTVVIPQNCTIKILGFKPHNTTDSRQHDTLDVSPTGISSFDQLKIESLISAANTSLRTRQLTTEHESTKISSKEELEVILDGISPEVISAPDFLFAQPPSPTPYPTTSTPSVIGPIIGGITAGAVVIAAAIGITIFCLKRASNSIVQDPTIAFTAVVVTLSAQPSKAETHESETSHHYDQDIVGDVIPCN